MIYIRKKSTRKWKKLKFHLSKEWWTSWFPNSLFVIPKCMKHVPNPQFENPEFLLEMVIIGLFNSLCRGIWLTLWFSLSIDNHSFYFQSFIVWLQWCTFANFSKWKTRQQYVGDVKQCMEVSQFWPSILAVREVSFNAQNSLLTTISALTPIIWSCLYRQWQRT